MGWFKLNATVPLKVVCDEKEGGAGAVCNERELFEIKDDNKIKRQCSSVTAEYSTILSNVPMYKQNAANCSPQF